MTDHGELKRLAERMKGWDKISDCWPCDENGPDWQVGYVGESDERYPLLTVDSEQYDQEQDAPMIAQYYAAANPAAVLALIAEVDQLKAEVARSTEREIMQLAEIEALRKNSERYQWTATEGNWVARMFGKWRAHVGQYGDANPTEWFDSREEAIDAAITKGAKSCTYTT